LLIVLLLGGRGVSAESPEALGLATFGALEKNFRRDVCIFSATVSGYFYNCRVQYSRPLKGQCHEIVAKMSPWSSSLGLK
jgi:hypothetical protein